MIFLPQEIQDKIFLYLDYKTLNSCRELQSDYVIKCTKSDNFYLAIITKNIWNEKWLRQQGNTYIPTTLSEAVLVNSNVETLEFMYTTGIRPDSDTFEILADKCNLEGMKWLHSKGCRVSNNVINSSAENGSLEILKWLKEIGENMTEYVFEISARKGNLQILKWLRYQECPQGHRAIENAIRGGHIDVIKWLISIGHTLSDNDFTIHTNTKEIINFLANSKRAHVT